MQRGISLLARLELVHGLNVSTCDRLSIDVDSHCVKFKRLPELCALNSLLQVVPIEPEQFGKVSGLVWRVRRGRLAPAGSVAGHRKVCKKQKGRVDWKIKIEGSVYTLARVVYYMSHGVDPAEQTVDHVDRNTDNNNVDNLRLTSKVPQAHNVGVRSDNVSGVIGVSQVKYNGKWVAQLRFNKETLLNRRFTCKREAALAYREAVLKLPSGVVKPHTPVEIVECTCGRCIIKQR